MTIDLYEKIEQYLQGKLPENERLLWEENMQNDPELARQVEEHRLLFNSFAVFKERNALRHKLNGLHREIKKAGHIPARTRTYQLGVWSKRYLPTMAVAASVAILTVFSTLFITNHLQNLEQKQNSFYQQLRLEQRRGIESIKNELKAATETAPEPNARYTATGFVIAPNGYLVTNQHVIRNADSVYVESMTDHIRYKVQVIHSDERLDLSVLKIVDKKFKGFAALPYTVARKESELGESVYTLAFPRTNMDMVYGDGSISAKSDYQGDTVKYQVSIPVNPGNSGSPVIDAFGNLVGIVSGKYTEVDGATSAIKSRYLYAVLDSLGKNEGEKIFLPKNNLLRYSARPQQIKKWQPFVFSVRVYNSEK
jgi:serine protease Do